MRVVAGRNLEWAPRLYLGKSNCYSSLQSLGKEIGSCLDREESTDAIIVKLVQAMLITVAAALGGYIIRCHRLEPKN